MLFWTAITTKRRAEHWNVYRFLTNIFTFINGSILIKSLIGNSFVRLRSFACLRVRWWGPTHIFVAQDWNPYTGVTASLRIKLEKRLDEKQY
jgi:hypothetical protein